MAEDAVVEEAAEAVETVEAPEVAETAETAETVKAVEGQVEAVETPVEKTDIPFTNKFIESIKDEELKNSKVWERLKDKDEDEFARYITELVSYNGKKGDIPGDDADEGAWNEFYTKMGRPDTIDGYDFSIGQDFQEAVGEENLPYYQTMVDGFKEQAFTMGLSEKKAAEQVEWYLDKVASDVKEVSEINKANKEKNQALIDKEWGDSKESITGAIHAMLQKKGADIEAIEASGVMNMPQLAVALGKIATDLADDPEIGHHMTRTVTGLHDQLGEVEQQIKEDMRIGKKVPKHLRDRRMSIMNKLGDNL